MNVNLTLKEVSYIYQLIQIEVPIARHLDLTKRKKLPENNKIHFCNSEC